ncbi:MAG: bifunctional 5,10-methylene-tetrahydrofolate dehydrogenase/5,10-methylene-tetrahydrofolate cyclohydrolase [Chloroflexi bacterium]|nr:bifunctional 5,10-methylene-tetrahydrofolate dehydrogenase/5,10-methylene-tetrahydrofolate cyclohydrolase [Chloroflexota bacterium]|tara:strand:- start:3102 stop:3974 length:873 start_codon:yes stop_codon:yes gene_type:complete
MKIIDGKNISKEIIKNIQEKVQLKIQADSYSPKLAIILVGDDYASLTYVSAKIRTCEKVGISTQLFKFDDNVKNGQVIDKINELNINPDYHGILVQLPLPSHLNQREILDIINPLKDVDGLTSSNTGLLALNRPRFIPATPLGIQKLLIESKVEIEGKNIVICGRSNIVGKPLFNLFSNDQVNANATVTLCHSKTKNLINHTKNADILIVAVGKPEFINESMVKEGSIVIDVGINRVKDDFNNKGYRIVGDVNFDSLMNKVSMITPVPGGVGPMTIAMLLENVLKSASYI